MTKLEKAFKENLDAQKELTKALIELLEVIKKIFNGEPSEEVPNEVVEDEIEQIQLEKHEAGEESPKDIEESENSGIVHEDTENPV